MHCPLRRLLFTGHFTVASVYSHISKVPPSSLVFLPDSSEHAPLSCWCLLLCQGCQWRPAITWKVACPGPLSWQEPGLVKTSTQAGIHDSFWVTFSTPEGSFASDSLWLGKKSPLVSSTTLECMIRSNLVLNSLPFCFLFLFEHISLLKGREMLSPTPSTPFSLFCLSLTHTE